MLTVWNTIPTVDRVFDDVMRSAFRGASAPARFTPAVDIRAKEEELVLTFDVPGVKREDLDVTLEKNVLTVKGARHWQAGEEERVTVGRAYGDFKLSYTLPDGIDGEKLSADLSDGVLTLRVPRIPKAQPRKISIGGSNGSPE
jgi:HSP20 family protein